MAKAASMDIRNMFGVASQALQASTDKGKETQSAERDTKRTKLDHILQRLESRRARITRGDDDEGVGVELEHEAMSEDDPADYNSDDLDFVKPHSDDDVLNENRSSKEIRKLNKALRSKGSRQERVDAMQSDDEEDDESEIDGDAPILTIEQENDILIQEAKAERRHRAIQAKQQSRRQQQITSDEDEEEYHRPNHRQAAEFMQMDVDVQQQQEQEQEYAVDAAANNEESDEEEPKETDWDDAIRQQQASRWQAQNLNDDYDIDLDSYVVHTSEEEAVPEATRNAVRKFHAPQCPGCAEQTLVYRLNESQDELHVGDLQWLISGTQLPCLDKNDSNKVMQVGMCLMTGSGMMPSAENAVVEMLKVDINDMQEMLEDPDLEEFIEGMIPVYYPNPRNENKPTRQKINSDALAPVFRQIARDLIHKRFKGECPIDFHICK